jgi:hypothetical protein
MTTPLAERYLAEQHAWGDVASRALNGEPELIAVSRWKPDSRAYATADKVAVIERRDQASLRAKSASVQALQRLQRPYSKGDEASWTWLVTDRIAGKTLEQVRDNLGLAERLEIVRATLRSVRAMNNKGVAHCDLRLDNLMLTDSGDVVAIDFDRSFTRTPIEAYAADWIGVSRLGLSYYPVWKFAAYLMLPMVSRIGGWVAPRVRRICGRWRSPERSASLSALSDVWTANARLSRRKTSGLGYLVHIDGVILPGPVALELAWRAIMSRVDFRGARLVSASAGMAVLPVLAMLHGAQSAQLLCDSGAQRSWAETLAREFGVRLDILPKAVKPSEIVASNVRNCDVLILDALNYTEFSRSGLLSRLESNRWLICECLSRSPDHVAADILADGYREVEVVRGSSRRDAGIVIAGR